MDAETFLNLAFVKVNNFTFLFDIYSLFPYKKIVWHEMWKNSAAPLQYHHGPPGARKPPVVDPCFVFDQKIHWYQFKSTSTFFNKNTLSGLY